MNNKILKALKWRYAVKEFDTQKKVSDEDFNTILESARLAPSSLGLEAWKFVVVRNSQLRKRLFDEASPQAKVIEASHFVVIARRTDVRKNITAERLTRTAEASGTSVESLGGLKDMINGFIKGLDDRQLDAWTTNQAYIPLGMMLETAALLGVDAGPMEGFNKEGFDKILGLTDHNLASVVAIGFGYRGDDPAAERPKVRRSLKDVVLNLE